MSLERTPDARAIRAALARQDPSMVRRVALDEHAALAVADLIEWAPKAEAVIQAAREAHELRGGDDYEAQKALAAALCALDGEDTRP